MTELLKKGAKFDWGQKCEDAFHALRQHLTTTTTGIRAFAECRWLCRVLFIGHSAKKALPSAALGNVLRSVKS
jgi:hypothetical protein